MKKIKVFIDGAEGTTGLKIKDMLEARTDVHLIKIDDKDRKDLKVRAEKINCADVVYLCLPDDAAKQSVSVVTNRNTIIIDTSTAHRCNDDWAYGFPELSETHSKKIRNSKRIAVPGCHATGFISIVYPLVQAGILPKDYPLACHSVTGYSGGGKTMIAQYQTGTNDVSLASPRQYALAQQHKHLPEMVKHSGVDTAPVFNPIVSNFFNGMAVSVPLHTKLMNGNVTPIKVFETLKKHYANSLFITVTNENEGILPANEIVGSCKMRINISGNNERLTVTALLDNLGKGASGAAMQNMNIALGIEETKGIMENAN